MGKLAIHGGNRVRKTFLPYGHQSIGKAEKTAIMKALDNDWLTQGYLVEKFEQNLCKYTGASYAVVVSSGTAALHLAVLALCNNKPQCIYTSPLSFVATSNSILYSGSDLQFGDIDKHTLLLNPEPPQKCTGSIIVHYAGLPHNHEEWSSFKGWVLEDAAHSFGSERLIANEWIRVGAQNTDSASIFSFHPVKTITTAEGGAVLTDNLALAEEIRSLRSHGISRYPGTIALHYEQRRLGFNYRLPDINCALGIVQLHRLPGFVKKRRLLAERYKQKLNGWESLVLPNEPKGLKSCWHIYPIRLNLTKLSVSRDDVFEAMRAENIGVQLHYIPIYRQPFYMKRFSFNCSDFPNTEDAYKRLLTLPLFPDMSFSDQDDVINALDKVLSFFQL